MPKPSPTPRSRAVLFTVVTALAVAAIGCSTGEPEAEPSSPDGLPTTSASVPQTSPSTTDGGGGGEQVRVVAAGDIACVPSMPPSAYECQHEATAQLVESLDARIVLALGDLQYEFGEAANFEQSYDPTWGRFRHRTRPAVGNHEYAGGRARGYYGYWGDTAAPSNGWYSFDVPGVGWHVVVLNSVCSVVGCGEGSPQHRWLRADLAGHRDARCVIATMHHPRWTSGFHGDDASVDPLVRELVAAGADVMLAGHDHHYERFAPRDGLRQFVVGTGGRNLYPVIGRTAGSEHVEANHFGVLELTLADGSYGWRFVAVGGRVLDEGSTDCT